MVACIFPLIRVELTCLPCHASPMLPGMFIVSEAEAAAIRTAYERDSGMFVVSTTKAAAIRASLIKRASYRPRTKLWRCTDDFQSSASAQGGFH
jgi:hypothetical protein